MIQKLKRLSRMSTPEIAHRIRERFRRQADRLRFHTKLQLDDDPQLEELIRRNGSSMKTYMQRSARRFYVSIHDRKNTVESYKLQHPEWFQRAIQGADVLCEHRVNLLAYREIDLDAYIDWHRDPVCGFRWPLRYCADYDLINEPRGMMGIGNLGVR